MFRLNLVDFMVVLLAVMFSLRGMYRYLQCSVRTCDRQFLKPQTPSYFFILLETDFVLLTRAHG